MKFVPFAIVFAAGLVLYLRRARHAGNGGARRRAPATSGRSTRWHVPLGDTGLVAAREVRERLRGRLFRVITLILLAVVAAAVVIPTLHHSSSHPTVRVGVVGAVPASVRHDIVRVAQKSGTTAVLVPEADRAQAKAALGADHLGLVVDGGDRVLVKTPSKRAGTTAVATLAHSVATLLGVGHAFAAAGLTPAQAAAVAGARPVPVESVQAGGPSSAAVATTAVGLVLVFVMLTQYLTWTLMGVLEEKTSRVVEVLLATVRPIQLLGGKVLGIGLVALLQAGLVVAVALLAARAVGSDLLAGSTPAVVGVTLAWLVLGYAFYSWVYAAAGSMSARQDEVQSLALPLSVPLIVGYIVGLTSIGSSSASLLVTVFAYLPPTAPFGMPVLVAHGQATWWDLLASAAASIAATVVVARLAAGIYRRAVLQTGRRLTVREVAALLRAPRRSSRPPRLTSSAG